jgi:hypothetical protein
MGLLPDSNNHTYETTPLNEMGSANVKGKKRKTRASEIFSSFRGIFRKKENKPERLNDNVSESNFTPLNQQTPDVTAALPQVKPVATTQRPYSFSNLPLKTQCLLNSKKDFDTLLASNVEDDDSDIFLKSKEVKVYITEPQTRFKNQAHHYTSIFSSRNDSNYKNTQTSLYSYLEAYSKQKNASSSSSANDDSFDLTFIDLHCSNSVNESDFSLKNKYFRRMLSKNVLNELLNVKNSNSISRLPSNCIFLVSYFFFL